MIYAEPQVFTLRWLVDLFVLYCPVYLIVREYLFSAKESMMPDKPPRRKEDFCCHGFEVEAAI